MKDVVIAQQAEKIAQLEAELALARAPVQPMLAVTPCEISINIALSMFTDYRWIDVADPPTHTHSVPLSVVSTDNDAVAAATLDMMVGTDLVALEPSESLASIELQDASISATNSHHSMQPTTNPDCSHRLPHGRGYGDGGRI